MPPLVSAGVRQRLSALIPLIAAILILSLVLTNQQKDHYSQSSINLHDNLHDALSTWDGVKPLEQVDVSSLKLGGQDKVHQGINEAQDSVIDTEQYPKSDRAEDDYDSLTFTLLRDPDSSSAYPPVQLKSRLYPAFCSFAERTVTSLGDFLLGVFGFDEDDWFGLAGDRDEVDAEGLEGGAGAALAGWSESSVSVERTHSLYPSRPSSFGPHLVREPLRGMLYPLPSVVSTDSYGCTPRPAAPSPLSPPDGADWIALVQRGKCPFSDKVKLAQARGAKAVVFGDMEESEGGISGGKGLLTPWSPDDTSDIHIPSLFVSRASYLSLLKSWQGEQERAKENPHAPTMEDSDTQTELSAGKKPQAGPRAYGLEVVLSKEEMFTWPLLDLLFLLLFLPSLLTLVTVFTQHVRRARAAKAERAPKDVVARLPVFRWGETEKAAAAAEQPNDDEERNIGSPLNETSPLLAPPRRPPSLLQRVTSLLPTRVASYLPARFLPHPSSPSSPSKRLFAHPTNRYPSQTECPFCLSPFERGDLVMELPCGHIFHEEEVIGWLEGQRGICPTCRESVTAPPAQFPIEAPVPRPALSVDGASVLVNPLPTQPFATETPVEALTGTRGEHAASPVASSSSAPIEGFLKRAASSNEAEESKENGAK
ncbi:hypothetical protein JCM11641_002741 [Rhodosporidiobolus odoratus]